ncbi:hypothetical protein [Maribacter algicola]|nr:hypothetical protein [Maribacter algicola]
MKNVDFTNNQQPTTNNHQPTTLALSGAEGNNELPTIVNIS